MHFAEQVALAKRMVLSGIQGNFGRTLNEVDSDHEPIY
jgi:hypothetical protein